MAEITIPDVIEWFLPEAMRTKAATEAAPPAAGDSTAAAAAAQPDTKPAPDAQHIAVGKQIQAAFPDIKPTVDIYGKGAQAHGSPWKGPLADYEPLKTKLRQMGYHPKGKDIYIRAKVEVDLGTDANTLYLYITDDN